MKKRSSLLGLLLAPLGVLYLWLAFEAAQTTFGTGDIANYVILMFFVVLGVLGIAGGINIFRARR